MRLNRCLLGDCRDGMAAMQREGVRAQCVVTEVLSFPGYGVSRDGRFFSKLKLTHDNTGRLASTHGEWRELKPYMRKRYPWVAPCIAGKSYHRALHRLMLLTFVGPPAEGQEACHNNGDRSDCRIENLRWDSRANNHADKRRHGTATTGERNPRAKLSDAQVAQIRELKHQGVRNVDLAKQFDVHPVHISNLCRGTSRAPIMLPS